MFVLLLASVFTSDAAPEPRPRFIDTTNPEIQVQINFIIKFLDFFYNHNRTISGSVRSLRNASKLLD